MINIFEKNLLVIALKCRFLLVDTFLNNNLCQTVVNKIINKLLGII